MPPIIFSTDCGSFCCSRLSTRIFYRVSTAAAQSGALLRCACDVSSTYCVICLRRPHCARLVSTPACAASLRNPINIRVNLFPLPGIILMREHGGRRKRCYKQDKRNINDFFIRNIRARRLPLMIVRKSPI